MVDEIEDDADDAVFSVEGESDGVFEGGVGRLDDCPDAFAEFVKGFLGAYFGEGNPLCEGFELVEGFGGDAVGGDDAEGFVFGFDEEDEADFGGEDVGGGAEDDAQDFVEFDFFHQGSADREDIFAFALEGVDQGGIGHKAQG